MIELGEWVAGRDRIYLDKCFWIHLRAARTLALSPPGASDLLDSLMTGVSAGRLVCPISDALFLELMKQSDPATRGATAELIDELSCGITLSPEPTRVATEVAHFLHANAGYSVHPLEHLVWTKVPYILGSQHPVATAFPEDERLVVQKAFFDHLWEVSPSTMVGIIGEAWPLASPFVDIAYRLNRDNAAHAPSMKSFAQVYRDEINGVLELAAPIAADVLHDMAVKSLGLDIQPSADERKGITRQCLGLLRAAVRKPAGRRALRTLQVGALLHAALRWNRTQKLDANDIFDFHHAGAELGYCDALLTDGPMHTLLKQRHLAIERDFPCRVMSSVEEAAIWVRDRIA
ncbi:hypothetical protein R69749_06308 [Paraburkholderia domus]|uniref:PIN domain-containing protein n=1 Tax=Paraburkholderia nemoris TaxID=2793076 RepID=A0ABM8T7G4_9BURK|nr:hypothetical protein R75777_07895 [Paraburkholderia nemoris]CAE6862400.1 hypothetical protein R69776_08078 [Paraburkholderia nemoris]CAE6872250.1 hypothetical protein R69749_06308 [Paraburkholderia domus]